MAQGFGGVPSGEAEQADDDVAQSRHDSGCPHVAHLGAILVIADVPHPVQPVLDAPVAMDLRGQGRLWRRGGAGGGDQMDDLVALAAVLPDGPTDLGGLRCAGEVAQPGAVATLVVSVARRPWLLLVAE